MKRGRQQEFRVRGAVNREILGANMHVNNIAISEGLVLFYVDLRYYTYNFCTLSIDGTSHNLTDNCASSSIQRKWVSGKTK